MEKNRKYWKGIEELTNDTEYVKHADKEFPEFLPIKEQNENKHEDPFTSSRRDFLKLMGFSVAAVSLAACEAPVKKAIPYLNKPENLDPSIPNYYASTFFDGSDYASILIRTREGRPIKIAGNKLSTITKGGTGAKAQASVLGLYDMERYESFMKGEEKVAIKDADAEIKKSLASASNIRILSPTIISPSTKTAIGDFKEIYGSTKHVAYDTRSASGIIKANEKSFGKKVIPSYDFSKANVIVSVSADFLGTWLSPVTFSGQYAKTRKLDSEKYKEATMSRHYQFETRLSLTGANADYRTPITPSQEGLVVLALYEKLTGGGKFGDTAIDKMLDSIVKELNENKGKSLVVSGSNDPDVQMIVNAINNNLGNYGSTIDMEKPSLLRQGDDAEVEKLIDDIIAKKVDAVVFYGTNPVYTHPKGAKLKEAIKKLPLSISFATQPDETSSVCKFVCPDYHYLESWNDAEPMPGSYSLTQPGISPLFKETRQAQSSLLAWADKDTDFYKYIRKYWKETIAPSQDKTFDDFWNESLYKGVYETGSAVSPPAISEGEETAVVPVQEEGGEEETEETVVAPASEGLSGAISKIKKNYKAKPSGVEAVLYEKTGIGSGAMANNPWLQEMPDPISKATWGNYVAIPQKMASEQNLKQGDVVKVEAKGLPALTLPVLVQPGQAKNTVSIALGYGREVSGKVATGVGINAYPWLSFQEGDYSYVASGIKLSPTGDFDEIAQTQTHNTIMGRDIVQESVLDEFRKKPNAGREYVKIATSKGPVKPTNITLWKGHKYKNHSWGVVVDLNSCLGCAACTIACQVENNIPVVGKKEVIMRREMHWLRIDRYYSSESEESLETLEKAAENPQVVFQPMMCQHCNNAPCETVCPVLATTHSSEGLNQMTYNRCIGTRYCANNCPYKVRRFNWFHYAADKRFTDVNYPQTDDLGKMVLNPDVTVRSRGVMEKCTMCVQRIQAGKLKAKKEKRPLKDGDIVSACADACSTGAITFGDMNDKDSKISKILKIQKQESELYEHSKTGEEVYAITEPRAFHVLEEINVRPQVSYLTKIRNKKQEKAKKSENNA